MRAGEEEVHNTLLLRHSVHLRTGTLSLGIRSQTKNFSVIISSQSIKLWSIRCRYMEYDLEYDLSAFSTFGSAFEQSPSIIIDKGFFLPTIFPYHKEVP